MTDRLPINEIIIDPALQVRESLDDETIDDYAAAISRGDQFKPVIVFKDGETLRLADGFHRVKAHVAAQVAHVDAMIFPGDFRAALTYAISANEKNGRRPTAGDRARAYRLAVDNGLVKADDVEGVQGVLRCSTRWARELTRDARAAAKAVQDAEILRLAAEGKTQREIAKAVGVDQKTVSNRVEEKRKPFVFPQNSDIDLVDQSQPDPSAPEPRPVDPARTERYAAMEQELSDKLGKLAELKRKLNENKAANLHAEVHDPFWRAERIGDEIHAELYGARLMIESERRAGFPFILNPRGIGRIRETLQFILEFIDEQDAFHQRNGQPVYCEGHSTQH